MKFAGLRDFVGRGYADPLLRSTETSGFGDYRRAPFFRLAKPAYRAVWQIERALDACKEQMLCFFKGLNCEFTAHSRESLEEILKRIAAFKILEERLDGHPRAAEHWCTVHHVGIPGNRLLHCFHCYACGPVEKRRPVFADSS